ncbi:MAG: HAMP domain-containing sensor histidine kinase, partial [Gemmatimonadota bacterium]
LSDPSLRRREQDLGIATLVAAALGVLAAVVLSGIAARTVARPIQDLREAALAIGAGEGAGSRLERLPGELEPVYAALQQAAADVERSQRAERVLAWGEMARQVAHEIKNPLTPIRLGIQHLLRVHRERPADLGATLDVSGQRLLAEIDRLDGIARTFSRFALPAPEGPALEPVDVAAAVGEVIKLYRLGESPLQWRLTTEGAPLALARRGELVEVLVNLFENARDAGARAVEVAVSTDARAHGRPDTRTDREGNQPEGAAPAVRIVVSDDGRGIPPDVQPRVFEPRFSTTSSGSGLGLAIVKRLVDGWGASIALESAVGRGTTVTMRLRVPAAESAGDGSA